MGPSHSWKTAINAPGAAPGAPHRSNQHPTMPLRTISLWLIRLCILTVGAAAVGNVSSCLTAGANDRGGQLRHWTTLELAGIPVFVHQRSDQRGHFLLEPLLALPARAADGGPLATINESCVRLDRLTGEHYLSFPVSLRDDDLLHRAREKLLHAAPLSVAFMHPTSVSLTPVDDRLADGDWRLESLRISSEGRLGYLRLNCANHRACSLLRSELVEGKVEIFERFLFRLDAVSPDGCVTLSNLTKPVVVPGVSQIDVAHFARWSAAPHSPASNAVSNSTKDSACGRSTAAPLRLHRDFYIDGVPAVVMTRQPAEFWLEPLLSLEAGDGGVRAFRNASGWPGLSIRLVMVDSRIRSQAAKRLQPGTNGPMPPLRYLQLVDWRIEDGQPGLDGVQVDGLLLSTDRSVAHLRLMATRNTAADAAFVDELSAQIIANPTLLFDTLRFSFAFSTDEAPSAACQLAPPVYWTSRRPVTPHLSQFPISELQRSWLGRHGNETNSRCRLSTQPQVSKVLKFHDQPMVLWKRLDRLDSQQDDYLIEPLFLLRDEGPGSFSVAFDYARRRHFVTFQVNLRSEEAAGPAKQNLTHLANFRSVAFAWIGEISVGLLANFSGLTGVEFYSSYDQENGYLRLYCDRLEACASLGHYLSQSSEILLERLQINVTMATPDDGCLTPEPISKQILASGHLLSLAYLREKSPPRLVCSEAAYPRVLAPVQLPGSCQLVLHHSRNLRGGRSHFVEPAFCASSESQIQFDYLRGGPYLRLRLSLTNAAWLLKVKQILREETDAEAPTAFDTVDFMELWSLRIRQRAQLPGLEAGEFKVTPDGSEAELRIYCDSSLQCRTLLDNMQLNGTLLLENFNIEMTANLPSYDCWMPRPLRKRITQPSLTYFDLSYLNGKTRQVPGCDKPLPMRLFAIKSVDGCTVFIHKRLDTKAEYYIEPMFCFNGQVLLGYSYLTASPYASVGVDLSRPSVLDIVTAQLADLAPKRVAFLDVRKVNLTRANLSSQVYLVDSFSAALDRTRGEFRIICQTWRACRDLSSNLSLSPWLLFERIQLETLMANSADCELSTATHQQPTSAAEHFHLPLEALRLKLPTMSECAPDKEPRLLQILSLDGCPVTVYEQPGGSPNQRRRLLIEPLLCFHGNNASSSLSRGRDYLSGEEFVSLRLLLQSHSVLASLQAMLALPAAIAGSMRFAELWDVGVSEEAKAAGLRVARLGIAPDGNSAELRVVCGSRSTCEALAQSLVEEPTDYLRSVLFSVTSLTPSRRCYFKAQSAKRPLIIGLSWDRSCLHDRLDTADLRRTIVSSPLWPAVSRCPSHLWTACTVSRTGLSAYFFSRRLADWADARRFCRRRLGGDLAVIDSSLENAEVFAQVIGDSWIGMYRSGGRFMPVGGATGRSGGDIYRNFQSSTEGSGWQFNCAAISGVSGGVWLKASCNRHLRFVCQKRSSPI